MNKVPAFTMFRLLILVVLGFSLGMLLGACQKKKSENSPLGRFVGEWVDVKAPDRFVKISKNGDALIWEDNEGKYSAQFDKGMLKISAEMGEITAQFVESSGHIIAAGHEYIRKNDHNSGEMGMSPPSAVDSTRGLSPDLTRQKGSAPNGDAPSENSACAIGHKAALAVAKADPAVVLAGKQYLWDPDLIKSIQTSALAEARNFTGAELNDTVCDARMVCALPKLGAVYNWFWTRAVAAVVKPLPQSWQPKAGDAITLSPVAQFTMDTIGTDPSIYPELKIKQMAAHQFGCKATVEVTVKHEFAGFLTFHFWGKTGCKFIPANPAVADSQPQFQCSGERQLEDPGHTQTFYIQPYPQKAIKNKGRTFFTGDPGTYKIEVWAYNPIDEKTFGEHKQFENESEMKKFPGFAFCPKNTGTPTMDGCGCIGLVKNKITVTVDPDPFFVELDAESCKDAPGL